MGGKERESTNTEKSVLKKHLKSNAIKAGNPKFCHTTAHKSPRTLKKSHEKDLSHDSSAWPAGL